MFLVSIHRFLFRTNKNMTKILVIEDTPDIRENIVDLLDAEDFEAIGAINGKEGVKLAKNQNFDLIICDVMMPELDGYGVLNELRSNPDTANIPFIFLTAKGDKTDLRMGMNLGADDYLIKPCTHSELLEAITARLNRAAVQNQQLEKVTKELEKLEYIDSLTGLPNDLALAEFFSQNIANNTKSKNLIPFLLLGLDRFSRINDAIGYSNGNIILQELAQRLQNFTQQLDQAFVARFSGDEFAIILPPVVNTETGKNNATEILQLISQPFNVNGKYILVAGTIGIAFYPYTPNLEELRRQAGIALGEAKRQGGNRCQIYTRPMFGLDASKNLELAADLRGAWERKELQIFYQPRIDIRKNKIISVAAVIYWRHPKLGLISPSKVMTLAEESGFNMALNDWLLQNACQQVKNWQKVKLFIKVAVNISEQFFTLPNFSKNIFQLLQNTGLESRYLELEITADTIAKAKNANEMAGKLLDLKRQGITNTISQFEPRHTSLEYLKDLPLDNLKFDRSLIVNIGQNAVLINAISQIAHNLKLRVIADGVETDVQVNALKKQKCDELQQEAALSELEIKKFFGKM